MTISLPPMTAIHATGSTSHELKWAAIPWSYPYPHSLSLSGLRDAQSGMRRHDCTWCGTYFSKRAELKSRPLEEQQIAAECTKAYQATYREKHRNDLRLGEERRRIALYKARYGPDAYRLYLKARRQRTRQGAANRAGQTWYI
ncbi:hypothetical protein B0H14DRAFT_2555784 [Mycena olivaceomarginata]|nr:hypothetical protein B0H14DRAFT_2555784 [Mycena olivaceomarginata]